jgi:CRISPR-associated protein (TIGR02710 family)
MSQPGVLICTVGTGNIDQLRASLLEPLLKSIRRGEWRQVILLPSLLTAENAAALRQEAQDVAIDIRPLPRAGAEDDADACFAHFDGVLEAVRASSARPEEILVDFTRGTKAMSAALVLAAVRHDLPQLRYISGGKRDERGMVVPGTEIVAEVRTTMATARKLLDDACRLFRHGNFAAVLDLLPDPNPPSALSLPADLRPVVAQARTLAAFYAAWDRLDYRAAAASPPGGPGLDSRWNAFVPTAAVRDWVATLARPLPEDPKERAAPLRLLVTDLLANGERRLRDHQYEDAIIRGYRVLELIGQIRLFEHGLDSGALPADHPVVQKFQKELIKGKSAPLSTDEKTGKLLAARRQVARLLKRLGDSLGQRLLDVASNREGNLDLERRNNSIWIHGFEAIAGSEPAPLHKLYADLVELLVEDGGSAARARLALARSADFTGLSGGQHAKA